MPENELKITAQHVVTFTVDDVDILSRRDAKNDRVYSEDRLVATYDDRTPVLTAKLQLFTEDAFLFTCAESHMPEGTLIKPCLNHRGEIPGAHRLRPRDDKNQGLVAVISHVRKQTAAGYAPVGRLFFAHVADVIQNLYPNRVVAIYYITLWDENETPTMSPLRAACHTTFESATDDTTVLYAEKTAKSERIVDIT